MTELCEGTLAMKSFWNLLFLSIWIDLSTNSFFWGEVGGY